MHPHVPILVDHDGNLALRPIPSPQKGGGERRKAALWLLRRRSNGPQDLGAARARSNRPGWREADAGQWGEAAGRGGGRRPIERGGGAAEV